MADESVKFEDRLPASGPAKWAVAQWLGLKFELDVNVPRGFVGTKDDPFTDNGDVLVSGRHMKEQRIEVKGNRKNLWPNHDALFDDMIICDKRWYDEQEVKPVRFYLVDKSLRYAAVVPVAATRKHWFVDDVTDRGRGTYDGYWVNKKYIKDIVDLSDFTPPKEGGV